MATLGEIRMLHVMPRCMALDMWILLPAEKVGAGEEPCLEMWILFSLQEFTLMVLVTDTKSLTEANLREGRFILAHHCRGFTLAYDCS